MEANANLTVIVWLALLAAFVRAVSYGRLRQRAQQRVWLLYLLSVLAFTFWGATAEMSLDRHFGGQPVALHLKAVCLIGVCHLYRQMLRETDPAGHTGVGLDWLAPAAVGLAALSLLLYAWNAPVALPELRLIVIGARDAVVLTFILTAFLSGTWRLWQREGVPAMRLKQSAILLFFISYGITSLGSVSAGMMTVLGMGDAEQAAQLLQPFLYPTLFFFVLMLVPYRWYSGLFYLQRLLTYYRLLRLERALIRCMPLSPACERERDMIAGSGRLELAIYRTVIAILDSYPNLRDTEEGLMTFAAIQACVKDNPAYPDLVEALAAVRL